MTRGLVLASALAAATLAAVPALAEDMVPDKFTVELTAAQIQTISEGLMELPGYQRRPIIADMQAQLNKQLEAAKAKAEEAAKEKK